MHFQYPPRCGTLHVMPQIKMPAGAGHVVLKVMPVSVGDGEVGTGVHRPGLLT